MTTEAPLSSVEKAATRLTPDGRVLVLRTCDSNLQSHGRFQWPESGHVEAPDWNGKPTCGGGLHGLPWGVGGASYLSLDEDARWLVVAVDPADMVIVDGDKVKFKAGEVIACGTREDAVGLLVDQLVDPLPVNWATLTGGYGATLTGGYWATLTGGNGATLTGGYGATLTGGYGATLTGGNWATLTGGNGATLTGGDGATLTGGNGATLTGGNGATLTGGYGATLVFKYWDPTKERYRIKVWEVGEDGIEAGAAYRLNDDGSVTKVEVQA